MSAFAASSDSAFLARIATRAPDSANLMAVASPRPLLPPVIRAVRPSSRISICALLPLVRKTAGTIERQAEMPAQRLDGGSMLGIGIAIVRPDDDHPKGRVRFPAGRQHGRDDRRASGISQGQEQRHLAQDMRLEADLLLDECPRGRLE